MTTTITGLDSAHELLVKLLDQAPEDWMMRKKVSQVLADAGFHREASQMIWDAPEIPPVAEDIVFAARIVAKGQPTRAMRLINTAIESNVEQPEENLTFAKLLMKAHMPLQALRVYGAAVAQDAKLIDERFEISLLQADVETVSWNDEVRSDEFPWEGPEVIEDNATDEEKKEAHAALLSGLTQPVPLKSVSSQPKKEVAAKDDSKPEPERKLPTWKVQEGRATSKPSEVQANKPEASASDASNVKTSNEKTKLKVYQPDSKDESSKKVSETEKQSEKQSPNAKVGADNTSESREKEKLEKEKLEKEKLEKEKLEKEKLEKEKLEKEKLEKEKLEKEKLEKEKLEKEKLEKEKLEKEKLEKEKLEKEKLEKEKLEKEKLEKEELEKVASSDKDPKLSSEDLDDFVSGAMAEYESSKADLGEVKKSSDVDSGGMFSSLVNRFRKKKPAVEPEFKNPDQGKPAESVPSKIRTPINAAKPLVSNVSSGGTKKAAFKMPIAPVKQSAPPKKEEAKPSPTQLSAETNTSEQKKPVSLAHTPAQKPISGGHTSAQRPISKAIPEPELPKELDGRTQLVALAPENGGPFFDSLTEKYKDVDASKEVPPSAVAIARDMANVDYLELIQQACEKNLNAFSKLLSLHRVMAANDCMDWGEDMNLLRRGYGDAVLATIVSKYSVSECREILNSVYQHPASAAAV